MSFCPLMLITDSFTPLDEAQPPSQPPLGQELSVSFVYLDLQQRREVPAPAGPDHKQPFEEGCFCAEAEAEHRGAEVPRLPLGKKNLIKPM